MFTTCICACICFTDVRLVEPYRQEKKKNVWNENDCWHSKTRPKHRKGSKERYLFEQNMWILGVIPFVNLQNDTQTTNDEKQWKTRQRAKTLTCLKTQNWCVLALHLKNKRLNFAALHLIFHDIIVVQVSFCSLIKGITLKILMLCNFVLINSLLLNLLSVWILSRACYFQQRCLSQLDLEEGTVDQGNCQNTPSPEDVDVVELPSWTVGITQCVNTSCTLTNTIRWEDWLCVSTIFFVYIIILLTHHIDRHTLSLEDVSPVPENGCCYIPKTVCT